MEFNTDLSGFTEDSIEPCRTCGIYFTIGLDMDQKLVKPLFDTDDAAATDVAVGMVEILEQMSAWKLQVARDDGRPQYMCISCIAEFQKLLKFKRSCLETQEQFVELEVHREHNGMVIKREIDAEPEEQFCGFIYLDISDEEEISDEDGSRRVSAAFDIPHVPIKEEHMARVPIQTKATFQPPEPKELAAPIASNFEEMETDELANMFAASSADASSQADSDKDQEDEEDGEEEEGIIKFTYDDDCEAAATLPQPIYLPAIVTCKLCLHDSPNEEAHAEHMRQTHLLKDWECHICAKKFISAPESRVKFHMKWHKLQRHVKCPMCGFFCSSKDALREHKKAVHTRTKCTFCEKNIKTNLLQRHLTQHLKEREAELANELHLLQQSQVSATTTAVASETPSPPVVPTITVTTACPEALPSLGEESPSPRAGSATLEKLPSAIEDTSCVSDISESIPLPKDSSPLMEPLESVDFPASINAICVIQCAFCSDTFEDAEQLQAHVLATHRMPKRSHSPDKTPPTTPLVQSPKVSKPEIEEILPPTLLMQTISTEYDSPLDVSLNGSSPASQDSSVLQTSSDKQQQENSKTYSTCPFCDKSFDLKFKLNRHLMQHKKASLGL